MLFTTSTTEQIMDELDSKYSLQGYPKSNYLVTGLHLLIAGHVDLAVISFLRGAEQVGCVGCMFLYVYHQLQRKQVHLALPWAMEGAIRGHLRCIVLLLQCYDQSTSESVFALSNLWTKTMNKLQSSTNKNASFGEERRKEIYSIGEERRKEYKKQMANICVTCGEEDDTNNMTYAKCGLCKCYSYCCKDHQRKHWKEQNHMGECRQYSLLRQYCKPQYVQEIREAIARGEDPKDITRLQVIRTQLGLSRPKKQYEELVLLLGDDSKSQDRYTYLSAGKDGTVPIGSTPNLI
mmetsp:Transcript_36545/g.36959  ORF Transcript_36545/g.36959 Transcript_36545/m.36959 type:complete len:292 (+) Transcript_36545:47-922(+)